MGGGDFEEFEGGLDGKVLDDDGEDDDAEGEVEDLLACGEVAA